MKSVSSNAGQPVRRKQWRRGAALLLVLSASAASAQQVASNAPAETPAVALEAETVDSATLKPPYPHRLMLSGAVTGGVRIMDGNTAAIEAILFSSVYSSFVADPLQRNFFVAETTWSRGNHGDRHDFLTILDGKTANMVADVDLPGRLVSTAKANSIDVSADGKRVYVYNFQPASSVITVDVDGRKVQSVTETPGCGLVYAWGNGGFASLCTDGSLASVTLDAKGNGTMEQTAPFFDPEHDPVFDDSLVDRQSGKAFFMTFSGMIYPAQLAAKPVIGKPWSLQRAAGLPVASLDPGQWTWRPGGRRPMALHRPSGNLYILMHDGEHWTQKEPGSQIWVVNPLAHSIVSKIDLAEPAQVIAISQDDQPLIYTVTPNGKLSVLDAATGKLLRTAKGYGAYSASVAGF